jgi:hypothetical protein
MEWLKRLLARQPEVPKALHDEIVVLLKDRIRALEAEKAELWAQVKWVVQERAISPSLITGTAPAQRRTSIVPANPVASLQDVQPFSDEADARVLKAEQTAAEAQEKALLDELEDIAREQQEKGITPVPAEWLQEHRPAEEEAHVATA